MNCFIKSYNAKRAEKFGKKLTLTDKLIFAKSRPLVHTEFVFSARYNNFSFSATMRDNLNCCRFKTIDYTENPERWNSLTLPMTDEQEDRAWTKAKELEGKGYDLFGLLSLISDLEVIKPDKDKYWCCEAVSELVNSAYGVVIEEPHKTVPTGYHLDMEYWLEQYNAMQIVGLTKEIVNALGNDGAIK